MELGGVGVGDKIYFFFLLPPPPGLLGRTPPGEENLHSATPGRSRVKRGMTAYFLRGPIEGNYPTAFRGSPFTQ